MGIFLAITSQAVQADDLMSLWGVAELNDSKYLSAKHQYFSDQEIIDLSRADLLPSVSFQYEHKTTQQDFIQSDNSVYSGTDATYPTTSYGLSLTQSVFDYARWERFSQSKISANRAAVEYKLAKQELLLRLSESYFLVLERTDQLETLQAEKNAMLKHLTMSEKKHQSGLGRRVDVEESRARYLNALSKEVELESRLNDSRYALREVIGKEAGELSKLSPDLALKKPIPESADEWVEMSVNRNLELQSMNLALDIAGVEIGALRAEHYPTVDLIYTFKNTNTEGSVFGGASEINNSDLAIQLNVPIYSGGKTSSRIRQASEKRSSAYEDRNEKLRSVERSAHDAYSRIGEAIIKVDALDQSVKAQQHLLVSKKSGYQSGQSSLIEILDAEQDLSAAQQALTKSRYDYVLNVLRLKFSAGDLQEEDLVLVNGWLAK